MIYLDSSVVLSRLFIETVSPPESFWSQPFTSSRLLAYEVRNRVNLRLDFASLAATARAIIDPIELALSRPVLARAQAPFPITLRTLDGLHLASMDYLPANGQTLRIVSYDRRRIAAAASLGIAVEAGF